MRQPRPAERRLSIAATSALLVIASVGHAHAQSAEAEALFVDGDKLFKQGKLAEACDAFESSNRIEPRAGTLIRLGECREKNNQLASAWSAFKDALTRVKDPRKQKLATAKVAELEPRLSYLMVAVPADARIDGLTLTRNGKPLDPGLWNHEVPVDGGPFTVLANAPDHKSFTATATVPIEHGHVTLTVHPLEPVPVAEHHAPNGEAKKPPDGEHQKPVPAPSAFTTRRKIAVGLVVVGAGATIVGAVLGSSASGKKNDAYALCPDPAVACAQASEANSLISTAHDRALEADVGFGIGALAAIIGATLWFTGGPEHPGDVNVSANVMSRGGGFVLGGRF